MEDFDSRPIVVGVDGSPASLAALRWAVDEAGRRGCRVDAVLAWHRDQGMMIGPVPAGVMRRLAPEGERDRWKHVLFDAVAEMPAHAVVRKVLVSQDAGPTLTTMSQNAALLVVGTRGAGPIRAALLGSVSAYCLRHASCPVVVVHDQYRQPESLAAVTDSGVRVASGSLL